MGKRPLQELPIKPISTSESEKVFIQTKKQQQQQQLPKTSKKILVSSSVEPLGGRVQWRLNEWKKLTKDQFILECLKGCKINFTGEPIQNKFPHQSNFNKVQLSALHKMINELIEERE